MEEGRPSSSSSTLPPRWVDDVDLIHKEISTIVRLISTLNSMHANRVGTIFGRDLEHMEEKIEQMTKDITDRFRAAERLLKRVGAATKMEGGSDAMVGANVQRSLAKKLQELSADFRQKQRKYLREVQAQKGGGHAQTEEQFGISILDDTPDTVSAPQTSKQLAVADDLQEAVQSRDSEIAQIAQSIEELGSIFKELAVLVIDQGTILDRIDYNMEAVVEHTKQGVMQMQKASEHQKSARPMKCIVCLSLTIAVLLVILVLKHRRRGIL